MLNLDSLNMLIKEFGKIVCDADKKPIEEQLKFGYALINAGYHTALSNIETSVKFCKKNGLDIGEYAYEIAILSRAVSDALSNQPVEYFVGLDTKQSGMLIQILLTRCHVSMENFGILDNTNKDIYMEFKGVLGDSLSRDEIKKCVIPRFYDSVKCIIDRVGKTRAEKFFEAYSKMLPKPDMLRQLMHDAWDDDAMKYMWVLPDGLEVVQVVEEIPDFRGNYSDDYDFTDDEDIAKTNKIGFTTGMGKNINASVYYSKLGTRIKEYDQGTKSLGANLIHSLDAWIMRELIMRCAKAKFYQKKLKQVLWTRRDMEICSKNKAKIERLMSIWRETGICSLRVLHFLSKGAIIPKDYYDAIVKSVEHCPRDSFDVIAVHDEFMAHPRYAGQMQQAFNYILVELYEGRYLDYAGKVFGFNPMKIDAVDPKISKAIADSDYLLQ